MTPKYSILVPTCDRASLLWHTLRGLLAIPCNDIELVVSDNASTDDTASVIDTVRHDPRVVAIRTDRRLSMPDHWDFVFAKASGDFLIVNGDDDGFSPNLFAALDAVIADHDAKVITWRCGLYHHPDHFAEGTPNTLHFRAGHSGLALVMDRAEIIADYARLDFDFFPEGTRLCLSRALAQEIVDKTGRLFWPPCPDFSTPLMALLLCKPGQYVYIDKLLGFGGRSQYSNGGAFAKGGRPDRARDFFKEFAGEDPYPFHEPKIRFYYNGHAAGLSVAKHFFPQELDGVEQGAYILFKSFYEELRGVRYNPIIEEGFEARLEDYLRTAPEHVKLAARAAWQAVDEAASSASNGKSQTTRLKSRLAKLVLSRRAIKRAILHSGFSEQSQRVIAISGARHAFGNSCELMRAFDSIVASDDNLTLASVERAVKKNALLAACRI
jgi:glycosyltransferase involved in cell wall biosynthesis